MTREEAIKHLKDIRSDMWTVDSEVDAINMAITALEQPEIKGLIKEDGQIKILTAQHWIPCSEKLPDVAGFYWTTAVYASGNTRTMTSRFFDGTKWERRRRDYTKVIAWMPFPEPYKEDKR